MTGSATDLAGSPSAWDIPIHPSTSSGRTEISINLMAVKRLLGCSGLLRLTFGGRYYPEKPNGGADWGLRFAVTLLFPK